MFQTGGYYNQHGAYAEAPTADRDLNLNCTSNRAIAWDMAHVRLGGDTLTYVEVGWFEYMDAQYHHHWEGSTSWGTDGNVYGSTEFFYSCLNTHNVFYALELHDNPVGSGNWQLSFNCLDGSGSHVVHTWSTGYASGLPMEETGRYGGTATGMADSVRNLKYRTSATRWYLYAQNYCYPPNSASNRYTSSDGPAAYHTVKGGSFTCY